MKNYKKKGMRVLNEEGFSLVELIVVIAILGVLVLVIAPSLLTYNERSRAEKDSSTMDEVVNAVQLALADQEIYDEVLRFSTVDNVSCYVDTNSEANYSKVVTKKNPSGVDQYTFTSDARTLDETPYFAAGNMRGVTITFAPDKGSNGSTFDLKQGVVNQYIQINGNQRFGALPKLYNRVRSSVGEAVNASSQTYRNSEYTIFIIMGTVGGNDESAQDAVKMYGQWSGTNLPAVVSYQLVTDRVVGDTGNTIVEINDNKWNQENGNKLTLKPGDLNGGGSFTPNTSDGNQEKPLMNTRVNEEAGLYDVSGNLLVKWNDTEIDIEADYVSGASTTLKYAINQYPSTKKVVLPDGITKIGKSAVEQCSINEIIFPDGVEYISDSAFFLCPLKNIDLPDTIKYIGTSAFAACTTLKNIDLPKNLETTGDTVFALCQGLQTVTIDSSLKTIGYNIFSGCSALQSVTVASDNSNFVSVSGIVFNKNKTELILYPASKAGTTYSVPSTVKTIGPHAFAYSKNLTKVTLPSTLTEIGEYSFRSCTALTSVSLPSKITTVPAYAFAYCNKLTSLTLNSGLKTIQEHAFTCCEKLTSVTIPSTVTTIENRAFMQCLSLSSLSLGSGLKTLGEQAFYGNNLSYLNLPTNITSFGNNVFGWRQVDIRVYYGGRSYYSNPPSARYYYTWELNELLISKGYATSNVV